MKGMDGRSFLPVLKGKKQKGREFAFTHINTIASGRSYTMRSLQGKRYGLIWNGWHDGKTPFKNESMSGLTWKAMTKAAENDPALAKRVKHYLYRTPFEFYDYKKDIDALDNLLGDDEHEKLVARYGQELLKVMKKTKDHETARYQKALSKIQ
jgi:N-sulfoglucosamine sulfohydrolase